MIWYRIAPHIMEEIRVFERVCLRACLGMHRDPASNYKKMISNQIIYNKANIPRIDNFIIKLTRNHIKNTTSIKNNEHIKEPFKTEIDELKKSCSLGYLPVEVFTWLDSGGYIQNNDNVPIIYHISRHAFCQNILYNKDDLERNPEIKLILSQALPRRDRMDKSVRDVNKYPWLAIR